MGIAPQFLVDDFERSVAYYCRCLGFQLDFSYDGFYGSVSRDGCAIHLKCAPKTVADREHRKRHNHLDAYIAVTDASALHEAFAASGAMMLRGLETQSWQCRDFYVEDPDGYILCFSQALVSDVQDGLRGASRVGRHSTSASPRSRPISEART